VLFRDPTLLRLERLFGRYTDQHASRNDDQEVNEMARVERMPDYLTTLPEVILPFPGARGWLIQGDKTQVVFVEFSASHEIPEHTHAEQWEFVISGRVKVRMQGESREYGPGDNFFLPAGVPHGGSIQAGYRALIVLNEADKYKRKG
jgi:mannose-6-phosphate isomerase-like protein (cupin superfamily)